MTEEQIKQAAEEYASSTDARIEYDPYLINVTAFVAGVKYVLNNPQIVCRKFK